MPARIVFPFLIISTLVLGASSSEAAVRVESLATPHPFSGSSFGLRLREFESVRGNGNDQELYLGAGDLGRPANRVATDARYVLGANSFLFALEGGRLTAAINGRSLAVPDIFAFAQLDANQPLDTLRIGITDGAKNNGLITLDNLMLSGTDWRGNPVQKQALAPLAGVDFGGTQLWDVTGIDFRKDFTLTGTLGLFAAAGRFSPSAELNRVEMFVGDGPIGPAPVPEASSWIMMITGFAFIGTAVRGRARRRAQRVAA